MQLSTKSGRFHVVHPDRYAAATTVKKLQLIWWNRFISSNCLSLPLFLCLCISLKCLWSFRFMWNESLWFLIKSIFVVVSFFHFFICPWEMFCLCECNSNLNETKTFRSHFVPYLMWRSIERLECIQMEATIPSEREKSIMQSVRQAGWLCQTNLIHGTNALNH